MMNGNFFPRRTLRMIYVALPQTIRFGNKEITVHNPCVQYGIHETDMSAIKTFLKMNYGYDYIVGKTETELKNSFYATGHILKRRP